MRKIVEIHENGYNLRGYKTDDKYNPYRLYKVWYDRGWHRKQLVKYADFESLICHIYQMVMRCER